MLVYENVYVNGYANIERKHAPSERKQGWRVEYLSA